MSTLEKRELAVIVFATLHVSCCSVGVQGSQMLLVNTMRNVILIQGFRIQLDRFLPFPVLERKISLFSKRFPP